MTKVISKIDKKKKTKGRFSYPFLTKFPWAQSLMLLEGLRKEERLSYCHQECYPGDFLTGEVKRKP